jgi:hypothetical protein
MKADSKDNARAAALAMATGVFQVVKEHHSMNGVPNWLYEGIAAAEIRKRDEWEKNDATLPSLFLNPKIPLHILRDFGLPEIAETPSEMDQMLRFMGAALIKRGILPPQPLREFVVASLEKPDAPDRPARKASDLLFRDMIIGRVVDYIVETYGFKRTRSRHSKKQVDCAVSIVGEALAANNIGLSEDAIIKASDRRRRFLKRIPPGMSEKVRESVRKNQTLQSLESRTDEPSSAEFSDIMSRGAEEMGRDLGSEIAKLLKSMMEKPADHRDVIDEVVERIERRKPEYLKLTKRPWITDDRRK